MFCIGIIQRFKMRLRLIGEVSSFWHVRCQNAVRWSRSLSVGERHARGREWRGETGLGAQFYVFLFLCYGNLYHV